MRFTKSTLVLASALLMSCAGADDNVEATIRKNVETRLTEGTKLDSVRPTPYAGLYEVRIGREIYYADKTGTYLFTGEVIKLQTGENLTRARLAELLKINFSDLPLDLAMKSVKGDGKRVIAIFEDPYCGYCRKFRAETLAKLDNVTVYTYMYNVIKPESAAMSANVWCSADRNKAWDAWMLEGKPAPDAPPGCATPNDKVLALGDKLGLQGTPAIFFADGMRIEGAAGPEAMEAKFATIKQ